MLRKSEVQCRAVIQKVLKQDILNHEVTYKNKNKQEAHLSGKQELPCTDLNRYVFCSQFQFERCCYVTERLKKSRQTGNTTTEREVVFIGTKLADANVSTKKHTVRMKFCLRMNSQFTVFRDDSQSPYSN